MFQSIVFVFYVSFFYLFSSKSSKYSVYKSSTAFYGKALCIKKSSQFKMRFVQSKAKIRAKREAIIGQNNIIPRKTKSLFLCVLNNKIPFLSFYVFNPPKITNPQLDFIFSQYRYSSQERGLEKQTHYRIDLKYDKKIFSIFQPLLFSPLKSTVEYCYAVNGEKEAFIDFPYAPIVLVVLFMALHYSRKIYSTTQEKKISS